MRIGLLSDVHANLSGLRAVAAALAAEGRLDAVCVAGDHLGGGPRPVEVWEELGALGWLLVRGDCDESLARAECIEPDVKPAYRRAAVAFHAWTRRLVGPAALAQAAALPLEARLATPAGDLLVVHSSPRSVHDQCGGPHNSSREVAAAYGGTGAAMIAFGHWHGSFVRPTAFALLVNVASVGLRPDGEPLAAYTIVDAGPDGFVVHQRFARYDRDEEARVARERGMPIWCADDVARGQPASQSGAEPRPRGSDRERHAVEGEARA
jgi:predicted phosphodiesterase